jgi:hypothetical protein
LKGPVEKSGELKFDPLFLCKVQTFVFRWDPEGADISFRTSVAKNLPRYVQSAFTNLKSLM